MLIVRIVESLNTRLGALAGIGTILLIFSVVPDLLARGLFGTAIYGMAETSTMLLVFVVFLALPAAQLRKEHFYVAILDAKLPPAALRIVMLLRYVVSAIVTGIFAWYSITSAWEATLRLEQSYAVIAFPVWPARIAVACGFTLMTLQLVIDAVRLLMGGPLPSDQPEPSAN